MIEVKTLVQYQTNPDLIAEDDKQLADWLNRGWVIESVKIAWSDDYDLGYSGRVILLIRKSIDL